MKRDLLAPGDMDAFRREAPSWSDMPDELVVKTLAFQGWLANRRVRELGRLLAKELRLPQLVDWLERRLRRPEMR